MTRARLEIVGEWWHGHATTSACLVISDFLYGMVGTRNGRGHSSMVKRMEDIVEQGLLDVDDVRDGKQLKTVAL
jgi:hypothetical protein